MIQILKNIPFFSGLKDEELQMIGANVKMEYLPADHMIFQEGEEGEMMYIIKRGQVQVIRANTILATLEDGQFFGEMALVSEEPRNATVRTITDVELLTLSKYDFKALMQNFPSIAEEVSYEVVKRSNTLN